jgi:hypothetical protein
VRDTDEVAEMARHLPEAGQRGVDEVAGHGDGPREWARAVEDGAEEPRGGPEDRRLRLDLRREGGEEEVREEEVAELWREGERRSGEKGERTTATAARVRWPSRDRLAALRLRLPAGSEKESSVRREMNEIRGRGGEKKRIRSSNACGSHPGERVSPVNRGHGHPVVSCFALVDAF